MMLSTVTCTQRVQLGSEVFINRHLGLVANKRVGIICNHTSRLSNGVHLVDTLLHLGVNVTALFGPEHGIRGTASAGETIGRTTDAGTGLPVYSLYGKFKKPTPEMLADVDVLVFDIQDVGARFYTYLSTMAYAMEAAAEQGKSVIILDRPNPVNGVDVEGPLLDTAFRSFVGLFPIPPRHGMTLGELAKMIIGEKWLGLSSTVALTVIPMEGWHRIMWYDDTGLPWIPPSPNMRTVSTAVVYPGTCLFEGTNVSEGRGTDNPFEYIGAPWINADTIARRLNSLSPDGVRFEPLDFTPVADSVAAANPKYKNEPCHGVYVHVIDRSVYRPVSTALLMLSTLREFYQPQFQFHAKTFDRLAGTSSVRTELESKGAYSPENGDEKFKEARRKYLMYE